MTKEEKRKEEIQQAAIENNRRFAERRIGFIQGAEWSDEHPVNYDGEALLYAVNKTAERTKKEVIDKVCEWVKHNYHNYAHNRLGEEYIVNDLRKAMEK